MNKVILILLTPMIVLFSSGCLAPADPISFDGDYDTHPTDDSTESEDDRDTEQDETEATEEEDDSQDTGDEEETDTTEPVDTSDDTDDTETSDTSVSSDDDSDQETEESTETETQDDTAELPDTTDTETEVDTDTQSDTTQDTDPVILVLDDLNSICRYDGVFEHVNAGYVGDGYMNTDNASDVTLEWAVKAQATTIVTIEWKYSIGNAESRDAHVIVNGGQPKVLQFPSTSDWITWRTLQTQLQLAAGNNRISLVSINSSGLANVDTVTITGVGISTGSCDTAK